jgi:2-polyprenyl-6-methoxyphenol hydroxylase-like FAD-dependent oxidoreductase
MKLNDYLTIFFTSFLLINLSYADLQKSSEVLDILYRANPGLVTQTNPEILQNEAAKILKDKTREKALHDLLLGDLDEFTQARQLAIAHLKNSPLTGYKSVVVSGQSVTGMVAAAIAAQSGHKVNVYDIRMNMNFTREIQWSVRQALPDLLASIDPQLAQRYVSEVAKNLERGQFKRKANGDIKKYPPGMMITPDPRRIAQNASEILDSKSIATAQTRAFEKLMHEYLATFPNVTQRKGKIEIGPLDPKTGEHTVTQFEDITPEGQTKKVYRKIDIGNTLAIIAEGSGSSTRKSLGIESVPISPARMQVAGVVHLEDGGQISSNFRLVGDDQLVSNSLGTIGSNKRWLVGDIDESKILPDPLIFGKDVSNANYINERNRLLEKEFKSMAASNIGLPLSEVEKLKVTGSIEGGKLQTFILQQHLSHHASSGSNVLLLGDAVGNAHWNVGGGVHVGAISHAERFKQYLTAIDGGGSPLEAAKKYNQGVLQDSRAWGEKGLQYFYRSMSFGDSKKAYNEAADLFMEGKVKTPERALELIIPKGESGKNLKNIRLNCEDIVRRVLGDI